ncbi:MAG: sulfatase-like hydrolase/transferase [Actinobacteria bacterium]|nr:sulfatase-like hydrolase/transferase [Actinomycetota bacterium]
MKNVVLITIDALRRDAIGIYSKKNSLTPFIDSLRNKSIIFKNAQATGPYTQSSFQGILASSYYLEYGKEKNISSKKILISEVLKRNGITTAGFHSNAYLSYYFGYNRGWDHFYDSMQEEVSDMYPFIRGDAINLKVNYWLSNYVRQKNYNPFFLWVHYMDVHEPYIGEEKYIKLIDSNINIGKEKMFELFKEVILKRDISNCDNVELLKKLYESKVMETDNHIKELFDIFEKNKILEESIFIISSDHGDEFAEHGGLSHDGKMYSELISVPLLIVNWDQNKMINCEQLVSLIDLAPTIAYSYGLKTPEELKGQPLLPLDNYNKNNCYGEAMGKIGNKEKDTDKPVYYYREEDFKIIFKEDGNLWEMYNLKDDPGEKKNIINNSASKRLLKDKLIPMINRWIK